MDLITTTDLRTKTSFVVKKLLKGEESGLIHRSRFIGVITPQKEEQSKPINPKKLAAVLKKLEPKKKMTYKQLMKNYEHYMMYRHGPNFS